MILPQDIVKNTLSDYLEYEEIKELESIGFYLNPKRIQITNTHEGKHTYIDNDLRIIEHYNKKGDKLIKHHYKNNKLDGKYYKWFPISKNNRINGKSQNLCYEYNYKNGVKDGKQYRWYKNGNKHVEGNCEDGKLDGEQYQWHLNGVMSLKTYYIMDILNGVKQEWYENGVMKFEYRYTNGWLLEEPKMWDMKGNLI